MSPLGNVELFRFGVRLSRLCSAREPATNSAPLALRPLNPTALATWCWQMPHQLLSVATATVLIVPPSKSAASATRQKMTGGFFDSAAHSSRYNTIGGIL
jgi:hypothetical protein